MGKKLILGVTLGGSSRLLDGQASYFRKLGYDVYLISEDHYKERIFCEKEGIKHLPVDIVADINPLKDLKTLFQIIKHFRTIKPDIVNLGTPKMALLGLIAARLLGIKKRIYTCRGLRFETEKGILRKILIIIERITVNMAYKVVYVSPSLLTAAGNYKVLDNVKSIVLTSSNGVNIEAFDKLKINQDEVNQLKIKYGLKDCLVIGFVGRITRDKGVYELVNVFEDLYKKYHNLKLIMMGHIKCDKIFEHRFRSHPGIIHIPFQDNVPLHMSLFDIFVLPSWREGFPNVPIQAAALGLPVVVSDATGCIDSVNKDINGLVFKTRDKKSLYNALGLYIENKELRIKHGQEGIKWAQGFSQISIWNKIHHVYLSCY
ncbi:glycosyltransferase family 4 protein [Schleiferia thermophila]|uniref:Glycosyltransferase involved in cell wall biosynthesis n=1 Tax=Schleiferia thermophila TaxID=884107 RepID=A0A369A979_9FLAO|nr:glycosyltransferase family 4 protein [Schleiferia thermophila]RCX05681.1 glycosyltransferase involved in cell wall biosynthesis [Schleiferia thermophila]GCD78830.1 glycosyl transferase [Schleiferia thermophila]